MLYGESWGGCGDAALFVRVGFSDDRRLVVLIILVVLIVFVVFVVPLVVPLVVLVVFIIIVVGVSRRQRVVNDYDEAPVDQPGGNVFNGLSHVGSCRMSRHSWTDVSSRTGRRERGPGSAQSRENPAQAWGATRPSAARSKKLAHFSALGGGFLRWATSTRDETSYSLRCRPTQRMF